LIFTAPALIDLTLGVVLTLANHVGQGYLSVNDQRPDANCLTRR
jgi:hypothetical protein